MEFSIGIHCLHSTFPHWSDNRRCKKCHQIGIVSPSLKNTLSLEMLALHKTILERKKLDF